MSLRDLFLFPALGLALMSVGCVGSVSPVSPVPLVRQTWTHESTGETFSHASGVQYSVHWDSYPLMNAGGVSDAFISATSYFLACDCDSASRPVVFLFNGGPGASSSPLHFALGPRARVHGEGGTTFPDNPSSLIDAADLVFIDPAETGLSRAANDEARAEYLGVEGDAEAVSGFIKAWLKAHDREDAPVFLVGQSYGGFRLTKLLPRLEGVSILGLVMVSPMLDASISDTDMGYVFALPTMAAAAWRNGKLSLSSVTSEAGAWQAARNFAETDYLLALQKGDDLSPDDVQRIAEALAAFTGLDAEAISASGIRIDTQYFLENLLADENRLVSRLNTGLSTEKQPPANVDRPAAANDPSLALGRSNIIIADDIGEYLRAIAGVDTVEGYRSLNLEANFIWNWGGGRSYSATLSGMPQLAAYMSDHAGTQLLLFGGYRDLAVPLLGLDYILNHGGLPKDRVLLRPMLGGHSPYDEPDLSPEFSNAIRDLIRKQTNTVKLEAEE